MTEWTIANRTVLITGGNSGIGRATAVALARHGARVVITSRDAAAGRRAADDIARVAGQAVTATTLDLASFASIRRCAAWIQADHHELAVLINNAGVFIGNRRTTVDGFEMTFGVNHLGPFLLTCLLLPTLLESSPARIITVSSETHHRAKGDVGQLAEGHRPYRATAAYAGSKLANVLFTRELARRLHGTGVTAYAVHPGVVATRIAQDGDTRFVGYLWKAAKPLQRSSDEGARTPVFLALEPSLTRRSGEYFADERPAPVSATAGDEAAARRLWALSEQLTGCRFGTLR